MITRRVRWLSVRLALFPVLLFYKRCAQIVHQIIALGQERVDTRLAFRDVSSDVELTVNSHVIDGVQLQSVSVYT